MTTRELEICERVARIRKEVARWSQPDLSTAAGVTHHQLAGVEYGRAPLRYKLAIYLCKHFNISQRWLALGDLPMCPQYDVWMGYSVLEQPKSLFSWVFDNYIEHDTRIIEAAWIKELGEEKFRAGDFGGLEFTTLQMPKIAYANGAARSTEKLVGITLNWLPDDLKAIYSDCLLDADKAFRVKFKKQINEALPPSEREGFKKMGAVAESGLTKVIESGNCVSVTPKLPTLLKRLNEATRERGSKTALAKFMGVPLPNVSQWLSGEREPSGETTLQLLNWVEQQERQK